MKIGFFGISFSNNNLGLRALAYSTIRLIIKKYPNAEFFCFSMMSKNEPSEIEINSNKITLYPFFYHIGLKIFLANNIFHLYGRSLIYKWFHIALFRRNSLLGSIKGCDVIFDLSGGDSFSDIYGTKRFRAVCLQKAIVLNLGRRLVLLPQTYGPFKSSKAKRMAKVVISGAKNIFTRDRMSIYYLENELGIKKGIKVFPDITFSLPAKDFNWKHEKDFIGINISGLLYGGGYSRRNDYDLLCDYPRLIEKIISFYLTEIKKDVVLIPHVLGDKGIDCDGVAIRQILKERKHPGLSTIKPNFDEQEIRSVFEKAKFFIGARMHACIGAICQLTPTVCLAYSRKMKGVMETIGYDSFVLDLRKLNTDETLQKIKYMYSRKEEMKGILKKEIPKAQQKLETILAEI